MQIGEFDVTPLSDGHFRLDGGAMFGVIPKVLWEKRAPSDARNRVPLTLRPLLVRAGGQNVLIDAGVGSALDPKHAEFFGRDYTDGLDRSLADVGLTPSDINVVIATHLHFDHAGGFTMAAGDGYAPRFPRARYIIRRGEWDDATHPHERNRANYLAHTFVPLVDAGVVEFIEEDLEVLPGIRLRRTGGHTTHHQIVYLESGGRTAVFVADLIPSTAHVDAPWIMGFDLYPVDTLKFKKHFVEEAIEGEYVIFFEHDMHVVAGIIRSDAGHLHVEPV